MLIMQLARLGDLVQTWPLIKQLRQAYPQTRLSLLVDQPLLDLARLGPRIDELHTIDLKDVADLASRHPGAAYRTLSRSVEDLQSRKFDLVYNLNFSRLSLLVAHLLGAPVKGYEPAAGGREIWREPWLALVYGLVHARVFNRVHLSDVFCHLAPPSVVETVRPAPLPLPREPIIALQLATRHPRRTWPLSFFARLALLLIEALGAKLWLLGTAGERALGEHLTKSLPPHLRERVSNLQGRTSLPELADRLKDADLVISGDTGTLHLAAALGTQAVALFLGPAFCFETGPYGAGHVVIQAEPSCHPCAEAGPDCEEPLCQRMIAPELVAHAAFAIFGLKELRGDVHTPAGVRIYKSSMDQFGVNYEIQTGRPPGWVDLVGQAYRTAGAALLMHPFLPSPSLASVLSETDSQNLKELVGALRNGATAPQGPIVRQALTPLWAFRAALQRQAGWKGGEPAAQVWFQEVKVALSEELGKFVH
jgi:ADP-heptose:LPS heptosyltransferase